MPYWDDTGQSKQQYDKQHGDPTKDPSWSAETPDWTPAQKEMWKTAEQKANLGERINRWSNQNIPGRLRTNLKRRGSYIDKNPVVFDALLKEGLIAEYNLSSGILDR